MNRREPESLKRLAATAAEKEKQRHLQNLELGMVHQSILKLLDYPTSSDNSTTTLYDESVSHTTVRVLKKHDEHQHKLFKEFHQHVAENKIRDLQIMKNTNGSKCSFLVIRPAPAFLHIFYNVAPGYIVVQALSPCTQPRANKVIQEVERIITKEYGINIGTEHDASTWQTKLPMLSQNVALPTISEVEKLRIFQLLKKSEDENKQSQKEHSQELKLKQDECNREIKNKEDEYNKEMKSKDDKCDKIIKRKGDECGREVKSKEEECTKNLEKMSNNCDQKMKKIKDGVQACHKEMIKGMEDRTKETERKLFKQSKKMVELTKQMKTLERELKKKDNFQARVSSLQETVTELGQKNDHLTGNNTRLQMELDEAKMRILQLCTQTSTPSQTSVGTQVEQTDCSGTRAMYVPNQENLRRSTQETVGGSHVRLTNPPSETDPVERRVYIWYCFLIFILSRRLGGETAQFRGWASRMLNNGQIPADIADVFVELDHHRVITVENMQLLRQFFGEIQRYDLADLVYQFQQRNYANLYNAPNFLTLLGNPSNLLGSPDSLS